MGNDYNLMDLKYLAMYFNELLGSEFYVELNSLEIPLDDENVTAVSMQVARIPFAVNDVQSETLQLTLNFRVKLQPLSLKLNITNKMKELLGSKSFIISTFNENNIENGKYNVRTFLDMSQPLSDPMLDSGQLYADYQINGSALISNYYNGALIANDILTEISIDNGVNYFALPILVYESNNNKAAEQKQYFNDKITKPLIIANTLSVNLSALNLNRTVDKAIINAIECGNELDVKIKRTKSSGETQEFLCKLMSGKTTEQAGAYISYSLTFQRS